MSVRLRKLSLQDISKFSAVEEDVSFRYQAYDFYNRFISYIKRSIKNPYSKLYQDLEEYHSKRSNQVIIYAKELDTRYKDLIFVLESSSHSSYGMFGFSDSGNWPAIVLYFLMPDKYLSILTSEEQKEFDYLIDRLKRNKEIFIHEFIHYLDWERSGGYRDKSLLLHDDKKGRENYLNNPKEFNAYFQQTVSVLEDYLIDDPEEFWNNFLKYGVQNFIEKAISIIQDQIFQYLNERNKRRFKKRLFNLYNYYMDEFKIES